MTRTTQAQVDVADNVLNRNILKCEAKMWQMHTQQRNYIERRQATFDVIFAASEHHFSRRKQQNRAPWVVLAHRDGGKLLFVISAIWQKSTDGMQVKTWTICEDARCGHKVVNAGFGYFGAVF